MILVYSVKLNFSTKYLIPFGSIHHNLTFNRTLFTSIHLFNHYVVLEVPTNASAKEIKKAYLQKCQLYHPDKHLNNPSMHQKFLKVSEAYQTLIDDSSRKDYDIKLRIKTNNQRTNFNFKDQSKKDVRSSPEDVFKRYTFDAKHFGTPQTRSNYHRKNIILEPVIHMWTSYNRKRNPNYKPERKTVYRIYFLIAIFLYIGSIASIFLYDSSNRRNKSTMPISSISDLPKSHPAYMHLQRLKEKQAKASMEKNEDEVD